MEIIDEDTVEFMTDFINKLTEKQFEERLHKACQSQPYIFIRIYDQFEAMGYGQASTNFMTLAVIILYAYEHFYKITIPVIQKQQLKDVSYEMKRISRYIDMQKASDESIKEVYEKLSETIHQPSIKHLVSNILIDNDNSILLLQKEHSIECFTCISIMISVLDRATEKELN